MTKYTHMRILVFGAGVIGVTYAWQLSETGYDVTLLVRKQRSMRYKNSGISINCTDLRGRKKEFINTVFRPKITDHLEQGVVYDLIIVAVKNYQLKEAVSTLSKHPSHSHILFLGNLWDGFSLINNQLPKERTLFGFPGMAGGGRTEGSVNCLLLGNGNTILGEANGKSSQRLKDISQMMERAGMRPRISNNIVAWIKTHYIWPAASFGAICKAGSVGKFASNPALVKQSIIAMREGFRVCKKENISPARIFPYSLLYLPLFITTPLVKRSYTEEVIQLIEGYMKHGFEEMQKQYDELLTIGKKHGVDMTYFASFEKHILEAAKKRTAIP